MNKCFFTGNLTKDPQLTATQSGVAMCKFSIAVQSRFRNPEGEYDVDFIDVVAWRATAEFCGKYLKKGTRVSVIGSLHTNTYQSNDGNKRTSFNVQTDEVEILSARREEPPQIDDIQGSGAKTGTLCKTMSVDEELPF